MRLAAARVQEIQALSHAIGLYIHPLSSKYRQMLLSYILDFLDDPQRTGLVFQKLPKHMRRRAMSRNPKRLPAHLREAHIQQVSCAPIYHCQPNIYLGLWQLFTEDLLSSGMCSPFFFFFFFCRKL